jgi:hypothetical protein
MCVCAKMLGIIIAKFLLLCRWIEKNEILKWECLNKPLKDFFFFHSFFRATLSLSLGGNAEDKESGGGRKNRSIEILIQYVNKKYKYIYFDSILNIRATKSTLWFHQRLFSTKLFLIRILFFSSSHSMFIQWNEKFIDIVVFWFVAKHELSSCDLVRQKCQRI